MCNQNVKQVFFNFTKTSIWKSDIKQKLVFYINRLELKTSEFLLKFLRTTFFVRRDSRSFLSLPNTSFVSLLCRLGKAKFNIEIPIMASDKIFTLHEIEKSVTMSTCSQLGLYSNSKLQLL